MNSEGDSRGESGESGYVHTPDESETASGSDGPASESEGEGEGLGRKGWVLVGVVVLATLVLPGLIYLYPQFLADYVSFQVAMLAFPFLPAVLLGGLAVWSMTESAD